MVEKLSIMQKKHPEVSIPAATAAVAAIGKGVHSISRHIKKQKEEHKRNKTTYDHSTNQRIELKRKLTQKEKLELADRMKKGEKRTEALRNMNLVRDSKASGMLDFMKKGNKDDKFKKSSNSLDELNKKLLNANANSMDIWKQLNKKQVGSEKEQKKKQSALDWIKAHPAETVLFTALGAVGVKRVMDLANMGKQTYNTVKNWDKIMNAVDDMENDMQEYIRSSLGQ